MPKFCAGGLQIINNLLHITLRSTYSWDLMGGKYASHGKFDKNWVHRFPSFASPLFYSRNLCWIFLFSSSTFRLCPPFLQLSSTRFAQSCWLGCKHFFLVPCTRHVQSKQFLEEHALGTCMRPSQEVKSQENWLVSLWPSDPVLIPCFGSFGAALLSMQFFNQTSKLGDSRYGCQSWGVKQSIASLCIGVI